MARLKVRSESGKDEVIDLSADEITVGRSPRNTVQLDDTAASRRHCRLDRKGADWMLVDLGSSNGTLLNDSRLDENEQRPIAGGDVIRIGGTTLEFVEEVELELELDDDDGSEPDAALVFQSGDRIGDRIPLSPGSTSFGRSAKCTVQLQEAGISSEHFEIRLTGTDAVIRDLGSTNGTLLNGGKIIEAPLSPGDVIQFAKVQLRFLVAEGEDDGDGDLVGDGVSVLSGDEAPRRSALAAVLPLLLLAALGGGGYYASTLITARSPYQFPVAPEGSMLQEGWSLETPGAIEAWAIADDTSEVSLSRSRAQSGSASLQLSVAEAAEPRLVACRYQERLEVPSGEAVRVGAAVHAGSLDGMAGLSVRWFPTGTGVAMLREDFTPFCAGEKRFREVEHVLTPPADAAIAELGLVTFATSGKAYFDDIFLVPTGETARAATLESNGFDLRPGAKGAMDLLRGDLSLVRDLQLVRFRDEGAWPQQVFLVPGDSSAGGSYQIEGSVLLPDGSTAGAVRVSATSAATGFTIGYTVSEPAGIRFTLDPGLAAGGITTVSGESWNRYYRDFEGETADALLLGENNQLQVKFEPAMSVAVDTVDGEVICSARPLGGASGEAFSVLLQTAFDEERKTAQRLWIDAESARRSGALGESMTLLERIVREYPYNPKILADAESALRSARAAAEPELAALRASAGEATFFASEARYRELETEALELARRYESTTFGEEARAIATQARTEAEGLVRAADLAQADMTLARGEDLARGGHTALARIVLQSVIDRFPQSDVADRASGLLDTLKDS